MDTQSATYNTDLKKYNEELTVEYINILKQYLKYDACKVDTLNLKIINYNTYCKHIFIVYKNTSFVEQTINLYNKTVYVVYNKYYAHDKNITNYYTAIFYKYDVNNSIKLNNNVHKVFLFNTKLISFEKSYNVRELYLNDSSITIEILKNFPLLTCLYLTQNSHVIPDSTDKLYINKNPSN